MEAPMADQEWWRDGVIYQIYPRSFADSNGDGVGDLPGIIEHLDYLNDGTPRSLGVDAIWISPCFPSPGFDFGYDVSNYNDIDPLFGTLADFDRLVAEAHRRGIRVILDLVLNHTSHLHPWFVESRSARENPKRDWYIWHDGKPGGGRPNNWQSVFGGPAWDWDEQTRQYYYHMFLPQQPDLNWRNPEVRQAALDVFRFWLDRGADGFRLDVVDAYYKDDQLRDNPPAWGIRGYERQQHVYDRGRPELIETYAEIRRLLDSYGARLAVGEVMGDVEAAARYCQPGLLPLAFNFDFSYRPWSPASFQEAILRYEEKLGAGGWPCYVLGNHDSSRLASRYGERWPEARSKVAAAMLLTQRGTPFLYQGDEIGMRDGTLRRDEIQDPPGRRYWPIYPGRDPERTPIPWNGGPGAGFTVGKPWLPINRDYRQVNVEAEIDDPHSVLSYYRSLLALRKKSPALRTGAFRTLLRRPGQALAYLRTAPEQTMLVGLNFFDRPVRVRVDEPLPAGKWQLALSTHLPHSGSPHSEGMGGGALGGLVSEGTLVLQPHEAAIWKLV
jgi:alpha-glucosidase